MKSYAAMDVGQIAFLQNLENLENLTVRIAPLLMRDMAFVGTCVSRRFYL